MAFLSTTDRFGTDLDKCRQIHPNPSTYEPAHVTVADGASFHSTSRYGTIGPHHDVSMAVAAAASPAAKFLAEVLDTSPTASVLSQRRKAPTPWHYSPTVDGQFARVYTVDDLEEQRQLRLDVAKRTAVARSRSAAGFDTKPEAVQRLALGPGTYEVDKDWNLEAIAVPFSFGKEPRRGILDCSIGGKDVDSDRQRVDKYSKRLTSAQRQRSESALLPLRRATSGPWNDTTQIAALSKELAKSYIELQRSAARLERKLSSPVVRTEKFQRFDSSKCDRESFRRGPGSYVDSTSSPLKPETTEPSGGQRNTVVSAALPLDDAQREQLEALLARDTTTAQASNGQHSVVLKKASSTFGRVKHRDMLTSMSQAGHLSAVAVETALGPGVYESTASTFHEPTHNLLYKAGVSRKTATSKRPPSLRPSTEQLREQQTQDVREQWRTMRRGPTIL